MQVGGLAPPILASKYATFGKWLHLPRPQFSALSRRKVDNKVLTS